MSKSTKSIVAALMITAVAAAGCNDDTNTNDQARAREESKPRLETLTIPAGTHVLASLDTGLSSDTNHTGDAFVATTVEPIVVDGKTVVPVGTKIHGNLRDVQPSGRVQGRARMTLVYGEIVDASGKTHTLAAQPLTLQAASTTHSDVEKIAAGAVLGAVIGGIANGGKGAAVGAGAGAGAGTVLMLATEGDDVELKPGQKLSINTTTATSLPVLARK